MLFELIGSSDNDDDYHRIAIVDLKPDNYNQVLLNYTAESQEARGGRRNGELLFRMQFFWDNKWAEWKSKNVCASL
jgi:hypothetical protein